jgi:DUF1680 family protein
VSADKSLPAGEAVSVELDLVAADRSAPIVERELPALGPEVVALDVSATVSPVAGAAWPYDSVRAADSRPITLTLVPYHLWANRGPATMRVWLPSTEPTQSQ